MSYKKNPFWNLIYKIYPPILRILEKCRFHASRQDFLVGHVESTDHIKQLEYHLIQQWYEKVILAWMDPGEILSMRKLDNKIYQYHIRIFDDREVRWHYEYASEGSPIRHVLEIWFQDKSSYFRELLKDFLQ